jgi:iron complex outermembrane receptor protein
MHYNLPTRLALSAAPLAILASAPVAAQTREEDTDGAAAEAEIVVTGQFQQSLIDRIPIAPEELPFTLDIIDRDFLDERNFTRPIEALTTLPNITFTEDRLGTGTPDFLARGFEAPILIDNRVQNNFRGAGARDDAFVERYEVLKGPASISLGPIGAGGIINTVTKVPEADRFIGYELRGDHFGSFAAELDTNLGDITGNDTVLLRISGAYRDFQFDARETRRQTVAVRPVAIVNLGPSTSIKASASYTRTETNPNSGFPLLSNGEIPQQIDTDTFTGSANGEAIAEDQYYEAVFNHEFLDNLKLTVRGSYQQTDFDYQNTAGLYNYNYADGGPGIGLNDPFVYAYGFAGSTASDSTFVDAQLAYRADFWGNDQDFVIGGAYNETGFNRLFGRFRLLGAVGLDDLDTPRNPPLQDPANFTPFSAFESELYSVFGEFALRPTDRLTIIGGARYDDLEQINIRRGNGVPFDDDAWTVRIGTTYEATEGVNVYASFAQSFSPQFGDRRDSSALPPELSDGYEIGAKTNLLDGALSLNAAYFYAERQNVGVFDPANGPGEFFQASIGELTAQGIELSANIKLARGFNIDASYGFTDVDVKDGDLQATPFADENGSLYASYTVPEGALAGFGIRAGFRSIGAIPISNAITIDGYTVVDAGLSYKVNRAVNLSLDLLNLTDERYIENGASSLGRSLTGGAALGQPLTAVFTVRGSF